MGLCYSFPTTNHSIKALSSSRFYDISFLSKRTILKILVSRMNPEIHSSPLYHSLQRNPVQTRVPLEMFHKPRQQYLPCKQLYLFLSEGIDRCVSYALILGEI